MRDSPLNGSPHDTEDGQPNLLANYQAILDRQQLDWVTRRPFLRRIGTGGQGVVYLSARSGADGFSLPVALKLFSPEHFANTADYEREMTRIALVSSQVAEVQHDNLIDVHDFVAYDGLRMMEMEWVDGFDLQRLLKPGMLQHLQARVSEERWRDINEVVVTSGLEKPRLKPAFAIAVFRGCLSALDALHRRGIVHSDIKPANIMLKRTGTVKIIDIGSAFELRNRPDGGRCTPAYAAPEVLQGGVGSPAADLAGLGYVLIEMLTGALPFAGKKSLGAALKAKHTILDQIPQLLPPEELAFNELLIRLLRKLVHPDPARRFRTAEDADLARHGAAEFQNVLVKGDLSREYVAEIRHWMEEIEHTQFADRSSPAPDSESIYLASTRLADAE